MPTSAQFYVTVNGGSNQSAGIDVPSAATIAFVPASTAGWLRARWEIYDYPEGWSTPAGWSLAADGTVFYSGFTPPSFTMPSADDLWGVWMLRCLVNEQIDVGGDVAVASNENLLDDNNALSLLSPSGLRDMGARELAHFTTSMTRIKGWLRSWQRNLRAIESPGISLTTTDATTTRIRRYPIANGTARSLRAIVVAYNSDGSKHGEYEVKGLFKRTGGTLSIVNPATLGAAVTTNFETDAGMNVTVTLNGNTHVDINVVGLAATTFTWRMSDLFL